jgi:dihydropteroate synthase
MVLTLAILNLNPDSFSDGDEAMLEPEIALARTQKLLTQGANHIDIGAESTRPGASPVSTEEELARLAPFLEILGTGELNLKGRFSLDSRNSQVVRKVFKEYGQYFSFVNDVSGMQNNNMLSIVAEFVNPKVRLISMHSKGGVPPRLSSAEIPDDFYRHGLLEDLKVFWDRTISQMRRFEIDSSRLILDPGLGFGKNLKHSLEIIDLISKIKQEFGLPVLVGASRKSFLNLWKNQAEASTQELDDWTQEYNAMAVKAGAELLRVHYDKIN